MYPAEQCLCRPGALNAGLSRSPSIHIASWVLASQPELKDETPSTWLKQAGPMESLLDAARRGGWALA